MAFIKLEEVNIFKWTYNVMISFKENQTPIWELYYNFWEETIQSKAMILLLSSMIKNWGLNIFNTLVEVKWYNSFSDYLLILALHKGNQELLDELWTLFEFHVEEIDQEELDKRLEDDRKFKESLEQDEVVTEENKEEV